MGNYGELWGIMGFYGELWGIMGKFWGIMGLYGELWGIMGLYGVVWGCMGKFHDACATQVRKTFIHMASCQTPIGGGTIPFITKLKRPK